MPSTVRSRSCRLPSWLLRAAAPSARTGRSCMAKRDRPSSRRKRAVPKRSTRAPATIADLVHHAVRRFRAAKLVFAHGTTDPVAEAAFLVGEALGLPPDRFDAFSRGHVTAKERAAVLRLIERRVRTRKPAAYLVHKSYIQGVPFYVDEGVIVPRS